MFNVQYDAIQLHFNVGICVAGGCTLRMLAASCAIISTMFHVHYDAIKLQFHVGDMIVVCSQLVLIAQCSVSICNGQRSI